MKRLFVLFVSLFVLASMVHAEPKIENPGLPFQQLMGAIDETNVKIDTANDKIDQTIDRTKDLKKGHDVVEGLLKKQDDGIKVNFELLKQITEDVKETPVNSVLTTGSYSWIAPYWSIKEFGSSSTNWWKDYSYVTILNLSHKDSAIVLVSFSNHSSLAGELADFDIPAKASIRFLVENALSNEPMISEGHVRILSTQKVIVEGEILTTISHDNDYVGSHSRAMTWYPVRLELE